MHLIQHKNENMVKTSKVIAPWEIKQAITVQGDACHDTERLLNEH